MNPTATPPVLPPTMMTPGTMSPVPGTNMIMPPVTDIQAPLTIDLASMPETLTSPLYTPGFMRTQLGKLMRVEFLIGDVLNDRTGYLLSVGANYILLGAIDNSHTILCDLYSIKFVNILAYNTPLSAILQPINPS